MTPIRLATARAAQRACFVRSEGKLVLWSDDPEEFAKAAATFRQKMMVYIWQHSNSINQKVKHKSLAAGFSPSPSFSGRAWSSYLATPAISQSPSMADVNEKGDGSVDGEKAGSAAGFAVASGPEERTVPIQGALLAGLSCGFAVFVVSVTIRSVLHEYFLDFDPMHFPILAACPFMFLVVLFFANNCVGAVAQVLLPTYYGRNSVYYSAKAPVRRQLEFLPHMTIVIPVYKESLSETVAPSIESINAAIRTYELQGGTANLIVCEDGLQIVDEEERAIRTEYYQRKGAAFVARPKEGRTGRFKKSSNLNTMKAISLRIEVLMNEKRPAELMGWTPTNEEALYDECLRLALEERENLIWAQGNIRIGEYILLVDSDTRIPEDCFLDAAMEMEGSPEVGILQYCSGTFLAGSGFFENGIAFFTQIVNFSISNSISNGIVAPFMGHNAFLRWSALQEQALSNEGGLIWSEEHVSEDFVMSMHIIEAGYTIRWATYTDGFLEGVSLSAADELNRWQKYAFGVSEVCANPIRYWFTRSPMSKLFRRYLMGPAPLSLKYNTIAYLTSYLAFAVGAPLALILYVVYGLFIDTIDLAFLPQMEQYIAVIFVFSVFGNFATVVSRYRNRHATLARAFLDAIMWLPFLTTFFSGLSLHICTALLAHLTGYNMQWSATEKEVTQSSIWREIPAIFKRFWVAFAVMLPFIAGVIILSTSLVPIGWRIELLSVQFPALWIACGHVLYPFLLNPWVVTLAY